MHPALGESTESLRDLGRDKRSGLRQIFDGGGSRSERETFSTSAFAVETISTTVQLRVEDKAKNT